MKSHVTTLGVFIFIAIYSLSSSWADTLVMKDGSVLMGEILNQEKNILKFKTSYAGVINVTWDQVKTFQTDKPATIMLVTDELVKTKYISNIADGITQIKKEGEEWKTAFLSHNVTYINPDPWRLGQGYKTTARANVSLKSQHGNTIKDENWMVVWSFAACKIAIHLQVLWKMIIPKEQKQLTIGC